ELKLVKSGGGLIQPESSLRHSCAACGFTFPDFHMSLFYESPGKAPEWLGLIRNKANSYTTEYSPCVNGWVTISSDNSQSMLYLQMNTPRAENTAISYCTRLLHSEETLV
uniref:Immunoglobulin V-set domain-containing protein n=1 Tax=Rattus norvegicus TaxID=10116 RepID=F1M0U4_RAT